MELANKTDRPEQKALHLLYANRPVSVDEAGKEPDRRGDHNPTGRYNTLQKFILSSFDLKVEEIRQRYIAYCVKEQSITARVYSALVVGNRNQREEFAATHDKLLLDIEDSHQQTLREIRQMYVEGTEAHIENHYTDSFLAGIERNHHAQQMQ